MKKYTIVLSGLMAILISVLVSSTKVGAFGGCEENCEKCHTLDKKEVRQILAKFHAEDAEILGIKMSPVGGLWEVTVDEKGKKGMFYVGFSKKYVMTGRVFEVDAANKTPDGITAANGSPERHVDVSKIPLGDSLVLGDRNAPHKVIVFTDPECPFCARLHVQLKKVVSERKDIAFYLKLMPLKIHPDARWKAESIVCAKSIDMLDQNFEKKPIPKLSCKTKVVDETIKLAEQLGITGTPTLIMPDGLVVVGVRDAKTIEELASSPKKKG